MYAILNVFQQLTASCWHSSICSNSSGVPSSLALHNSAYCGEWARARWPASSRLSRRCLTTADGFVLVMEDWYVLQRCLAGNRRGQTPNGRLDKIPCLQGIQVSNCRQIPRGFTFASDGIFGRDRGFG